ncbi:hypothetical protein BHE74_00041553 [Ensete ventricosum]|nr:hypothetical protein GW17_00025136 [Ensete ventricosum]RWW52049.1 hypothetical protein BHE74_00041553 [Ensete ventricosum]RZS08649.1 hypothetical protein BHM03_00039671 [Ensete ventricosum]
MSTLAHATTHSEKARCSSLTSCSVCMHYAVICSLLLVSISNPKKKGGSFATCVRHRIWPQQHNRKRPQSAQKKTIGKDGDCSNRKVKAYSCVAASVLITCLAFAVAFSTVPWLQVDHCLSFLRLQNAGTGRRGEEKATTARALVGSRPPICERRCITCGHCEAVQVPVIPQENKSRSRQFLGMATVRGDYSSNYKPLSWKCKCGDLIFDP